MKYWISAEGSNETTFAYLLAKEIFRFDVRALINGRRELEELHIDDFRQSISVDDLQCFVRIGKNFKRPRIGRSIESFFISTNLLKLNSTQNIHHFAPVPSSNINYLGCYLNDVIKAYSFKNIVDRPNRHVIGILMSNSSSSLTEKIVEALMAETDYGFVLSKSMQGIKITSEAISYEEEFDLLRNASLVILEDNDSSLKAALLNCPQIFLKSGFFIEKFIGRNKRSIVNSLLGEPFIARTKRSINDIKSATNTLLNDHESYASFLSEYQKMKDVLGIEPTARKLAKEIVTLLEDKSTQL